MLLICRDAVNHDETETDIDFAARCSDKDEQRWLLRQEIIKYTRPSAYFSMFGLFAVSNILGRCVNSVYPDVEYLKLRARQHRMIWPLDKSKRQRSAVNIMWTFSTIGAAALGTDHFVPLVR